MVSETIRDLSFTYGGKREKTVRVFVPAHEEGETFPVIYMTDGQNLFEEERSTFGCWYTREAIRAERERSGRAAIIVAIFNNDGPAERANELTPRSVGEPFFPPDIPEEIKRQVAPEGEVFDDFTVNTVMPAVEREFPVKTGRNNTAFCGSSSGGLMSFYLAMRHPDLFCAAGVFSPAFTFYAPQDLIDWIRSAIRPGMPYLYLYCGGGDDMEKVLAQATDAVYNAMLECYPPEQLNEVILPEERHHEEAWAKIFADFLHTFLLRREEF